MTKFLYLYTGGTYPETPEAIKEVMDKWGAWMGSLGDKLVDGGAPLGEKQILGGGADTKVNGYSIVEAESIDAAKALADAHPHLEAGGGIEVAEFAEM